MTWGLEEKYLSRWNEINEGDVFLMHSTTDSLFYKRPISSIVGIGVVGGILRNKNNFLWIQEIKSQKNIWPLLVPFSEIYLFSELQEVSTWEAPDLTNSEEAVKLIQNLLKDAVPTSSFLERFPVMGSWSRVRDKQINDLFSKATPVLYNEFYTKPFTVAETLPKFLKINNAEESIRYVPTLKFLDGDKVKVRKIVNERSTFDRDNAILERAEENHANVLQTAIDFFKKKGFDTWSNQHVDLLAESEESAFLIEVKSTINSNFRNQARRAVGQLLEYEYFDVRRYFEGQSKDAPVDKILMITDDPMEGDYTKFLNSLNVHLTWPKGTHISVGGEAGQLAQLMQN